jgi:dynein heavy chain
MEPPQGVRENLRRTIGELPPETLDGPAGASPARLAPWRRLVFSCAFFHALVQERRRFGPLGWNIRYDFSAEDLDCALQTLRLFVPPAAGDSELSPPSDAVPWRALRYVTGEINYGGRVTDDNDRRLLGTMLARCYNAGVVETEGYSFTGDGAYALPSGGDHASTLAAVLALPHQDDPAVFGLHANADIAFNLQQSRALLGTALAVQPATGGGGGGGASGLPARSFEEQVEDIAADIQSRLPESLDLEKASVAFNPFAPLPSGHDNSLGIVLAQEAARYNALLATLSRSLSELRAAMKGQAVMSAELEGAARSLLNNQVPEAWARAAYPSLKPLASWVSNFSARFAALASWLYDGQPKAFWLPGLFFPQGFLTAALQNHARATRTPIDALSFDFHVLPAPDGGGHGPLDGGTELSRPDAGVLVTGLYLEGARWDGGASALAPPLPRQMASPLPPVHFLPMAAGARAATPVTTQMYACPLYKTSVRAGVLSTTGQSTNFVLHVRLPCAAGSTADDCALSGVAALCALDGDEE